MKRLSEQSLYEILEVPPGATCEEIEKAYAQAKELYAPGSIVTYTLMDPEEASYLAGRIEEARTVLLDPAARAAYDARLVAGPQPVRVEPAPLIPIAPASAPPPIIVAPLASACPPPPVVDVPAAAALQAAAPVAYATPLAREVAPPAPSPPAPMPPAVQARAARPDRPARPPRIIPPLRPAQPASPPADAPSPAPATLLAGAASAAPPAAPPSGGLATTPLPAPVPVAPGPKEFRLPEGTAWTGEMLRRVRESRGLSLQQIAERTKVARHHLESIEADRYAVLPAPVYLRGILMSFSKELRLDGQKVARSYLELATAATAEPLLPKVK